MADEIKLIIKMEGHGVTQLKGSVDQLKASLKQLSREPGISNNQRQQVAALRRDIENLINTQQKYGKVVESVNASMYRANKAGSSVRYGSTDAGTYERRIAYQKAKQDLADQKRIRSEQEKYAAYESRRIEGEIRRKEQLRVRGIAIQKRNAIIEAERKKQERSQAIRSMMATIGFGGLQMSQMFSGLLDNVNFSGTLAPSLSKAAGALGSIFGDLFGKVLSDLGDAIGTAAEAVANLIVNLFKTAFHAIGSFLSGIFMSFISMTFAPVANLAIGMVSGIVMAAMSVLQGIIEAGTQLLKDFIKVIGSLLSAAFTLIKGLFEAFAGIISGIWKGIWEGLKATAQAAWDFITGVTRSGFEALTKSFEDYAASQKLAARVFAQVSDAAEYQGMSLKQGTEQVRTMAQSLTTEFAIGLNDAIQGLYKITSAGITAKDTMSQIAKTAGTMALVSQHEDSFESLAQTLVKASQAYQVSGERINEFGGIITGATRLGSFDLKDYNSAIQSVIGSAAEAKVPFEELNMILALTSRSGLNLNRVTVGMNRLFDSLTNPTKQNSKAMKELGIDVAAMRKSGMSLIDILIEMEDKVPADKMREMFGTVQGVRAFRAIKSQMDAMGTGTERLKNIMKDWGKDVGEAMSLISNRMTRTKQAWENFKQSLSGKLFEDVLGAGLDILDEIISNLMNGLSKIDFSPLTKGLAEGMRNIWNTVKQIPEYISKITGLSFNWNNIIKEITGYIKILTDTLADPKTWTSVMRFAYQFVGYLKIGYEFIKKIFTDMSFAGKMFDLIGNAFKQIATFLVGVFKDAFEVAAAYAQATFLPSFKMIAKEFGAYILSSLGDAFGSINRSMMSKSAKIQPEMYDANGEPIYDLVDEIKKNSLEGVGGLFGELGNAANSQALSWKNPGREMTKQEPIFTVLKPILEEAVRSGNKQLIDSLAMAAFGEKSVATKNYISAPPDKIASFLENIVSSGNFEDSLKSTNKYRMDITRPDSYFVLNKILYALTEKGSLNKVVKGLDNESLKAQLESFGRSVAIEKERSEGKFKFGSLDFMGKLEERFTKLNSGLGSLLGNVGADIKKNDPELYDSIMKLQEESNKINFEISQEQKRVTQENTNAVSANTQAMNKKEINKDAMKHITRLIPAANAEGYMRKMRNLYPNMSIEGGGILQTGRGPMRMVEMGVDLNNLNKNTNKMVKKQEEQKQDIKKVLEKKETQKFVTLEEWARRQLEIRDRGKTKAQIDAETARLGSPEYLERWNKMMDETNGKALGLDADKWTEGGYKKEKENNVAKSLDGIATISEKMLEELKQMNRKSSMPSIQPPRDTSFWNKASTFSVMDIWEQN